jgi:hypothetical protein
LTWRKARQRTRNQQFDQNQFGAPLNEPCLFSKPWRLTMQSNRETLWQEITRFVAESWTNLRARQARLAGFDSAGPETDRIARDLGLSLSELRDLAGRDQHSADLLLCRLQALNIDPAKIEAAVMRDLQRCCSLCREKALCGHELEDRPRQASWPSYCPNGHTIGALLAASAAPANPPVRSQSS